MPGKTAVNAAIAREAETASMRPQRNAGENEEIKEIRSCQASMLQ